MTVTLFCKIKNGVMMKIRITQTTTIAGKEIAAGEIVDVDAGTFGILKSQNQALEVVEKPAPEATPEPEPTEATPQPETIEPETIEPETP